MASAFPQHKFSQVFCTLFGVTQLYSYILKHAKSVENQKSEFRGIHKICKYHIKKQKWKEAGRKWWQLLNTFITSQAKDFCKLQIYSSLLTRYDETHNCSSENIIASVNSKLKYKVDM